MSSRPSKISAPAAGGEEAGSFLSLGGVSSDCPTRTVTGGADRATGGEGAPPVLQELSVLLFGHNEWFKTYFQANKNDFIS